MRVTGTLTTALRRISAGASAVVLARRGSEPPSGSVSEDEDSASASQAAERRERERSQFSDDVAYFEFLIERALGRDAGDASEPA